MRGKIWNEMVNIKYGEIYLSKYLGFQRTLKKTFNIITLILSISGILGWKFFEDYAWIAFVLIAIMQLFNLIENEIVRSDKEVAEISKLKMQYTKYFHKQEMLWTEYHFDRITEKKATDKYFKLRKDYWVSIEKLDSKLNIKRYKRMMRKTEKETNHYLNKYHNYE